MEEAKRLDAIPYDVKNVELGHHGKECSFEAILKKYKLMNDPALVLLGKISMLRIPTTRSIINRKGPDLRQLPKASGTSATKTITT
ncbi:MAG TPA: chromate resistance protein ChrB domain-containing protein [Pseudolabrys sp.]|nr:chromate resistance protein ChrB domain-containing protein [Pseudolabrys sp.]